MSRNNTQLDFLWDISKTLSDSYDAEKIVSAIEQELKKYINCEKAEILIWDKNTKNVKNFAKSWIIIDKDKQEYYINQIFNTFEILKNAIIYKGYTLYIYIDLNTKGE